MSDLIVKYLTLKNPVQDYNSYTPLYYNNGKKVADVLKLETLMDNIHLEWNESFQHWEYIAIGISDQGYFKYHHVPGGYSEYTYEPSEDTILYKGYSLEQFVNLALTEQERQAIIKTIKGTANE